MFQAFLCFRNVHDGCGSGWQRRHFNLSCGMVGLAIGLLRNAPGTSAFVERKYPVSAFIAISCSSIIPAASSFENESRSGKTVWFSLPLCRINIVMVVSLPISRYRRIVTSLSLSSFSLALCHINVVRRWKMKVGRGRRLGPRYRFVISTSFAHGSTSTKF